MDDALDRIEMVLNAMTAAAGPRKLMAFLERPAPDMDAASQTEVLALIDLMLADDPNGTARLRFSNALRSWDNAKDVKWTGATTRNSADRRRLIYEKLQCPSDIVQRIDSLLPYYPLDEPVIISDTHTDWYLPTQGIRDYYWRTYVDYLRKQRGWNDLSILSLDNSTRAIVECLANPEAREAYASRGLVMGYVQSGKTANFMGVAARAADAGYRLIIVLAGTWNILRNQTQRRFDKELLGKELLGNDATYVNSPPPDWNEFLEHEAHPEKLGHFSWQRLTRPDIDFRSLKAAIDNLEFEKRDKAAPLHAPQNLHSLPVKLLVVKKHSGILGSLVKDLKVLRTKLAEIPALIIDDESDQAGLNTVDPRRPRKNGQTRTPTNARIVELLSLFPRGQYVGYTATPYANALVDPDDSADLFPKDFIVSLERPAGYMGVSDFFDPDTNYDDLDHSDYSLPENAYIRRVNNPLGSDDGDLMKALRSYVLAGAIKLYRHATAPSRYPVKDIKHHTMLVHTSQSKGEHESLAARLSGLWDRCAFNSPKGMMELKARWTDDYQKVASAIGDELVPSSFEDLIPYLSQAIKKIEHGTRFYLVMNSDSPDAPDFGADAVWKVVIGGNKLSRGYTIEGLTVSYYRRVAGTAETLMQMGRWFGFRPGYRDLVRVFLGVREGRREDVDLVALFKEVCRMEERFREDIRRYVRQPGQQRITPRDIPPLISVSGSLPPTAGNKMFNAVLAHKNFGGTRSMLTLAPIDPAPNIKAAEQLLSGSNQLGLVCFSGKREGVAARFDGHVLETTTQQICTFLEAYRWLETDYEYPERPVEVNLQLEFLRKQKHGIASWLIIAPQRKTSFGKPLPVAKLDLSVKERRRIPERGFQVFGEPVHRAFAEFIADIEQGSTSISEPDEAVRGLKGNHRGVLLLYPVREEEADKVSIGYELFFPENDLPYDVSFTVRRRSEANMVVIGGT